MYNIPAHKRYVYTFNVEKKDGPLYLCAEHPTPFILTNPANGNSYNSTDVFNYWPIDYDKKIILSSTINIFNVYLSYTGKLPTRFF